MPGTPSIGRRLTLIIWGSATLLFILLGAGALVQQHLATRHRAEESLQSIALLLSNGAQTAVAFEDASRAEELLASLRGNPLIVDARILLRNGLTLARQGSEPVLTQTPPPPLTPGLHVMDDHTVYNQAMFNGADRIATLQLAMTRLPLQAQTWKSVSWYGTGVVLILGLTLLQARLVHRTVVRPLAQLESLAMQYRENTDTTARAVPGGDDELGRLARSMNEMLDALRLREETLRRITLFQRTLLENAPHAIITTSPDRVITSMNPAACLLTGYAAEELVGQAGPEVFHDPAEIACAAAEMSRRLGRHIPPTLAALLEPDVHCLLGSHEWTFIRKDRSLRHVLLSVSKLQDAAGAVIGYVGMVTDMSERHEAEQERRRLEAQLHHHQKIEAIGTLAGGIAHDFNNILTGVIGNAELALEDLPADHPSALCVEELLKSAYRAKALVASILTFSRNHEQARSVVQLWPVINEAVSLLRASVPANIRIDTSTTEGCPPALADPGQIHQVVMNLGTNAAQAMEQKGGLMTITLHPVRVDERQAAAVPGLSPGPYIRLSVGDTGRGMDPATLARIFEPFFTTRPSGQGAGLGLSIVHGIVEKHGGAVDVETRQGLGSVFSVYLPIATATVPPSRSQGRLRASRDQGGGRRLLFVDDELPIARIALRALERDGYQVSCAGDAAEALKLFHGNPDAFSAVLTDLTMPGMNGLELAAEIRRIRTDIPILLCSGFGAGLNAAKAQELGLAGLLPKPYSTGELLCRVSDLVGPHPSGGARS